MIRIFSIVVPARIFTLFISEIVILCACYAASAYADPDIEDVSIFLLYDSGFFRLGIAVLFVILGLFFANLYADVRIRSRLALLQSLCMIFGAAIFGQGLLSYLKPEWIIPRKMMLGGTILAALVLFGWRLLFDRAAQHAVAAGTVLFLGMSPTVAKILRHFNAHPELGLTAMGYLESAGSPAPEGITRLGEMEELGAVLDQSVPNSIVIGNRDDIRPWWTDDFLTLRFSGVQVQEAGTLYERIFARKSVTDLWPSNTIFNRHGEPGSVSIGLQSVYSWVTALFVAVITLPITLAIALLIKLSSRNSVLITETRVGLNGAPFEAYRFRCTGPDGEYTGIGRFLQRRGLAWLPQLLNVLKGQMAIVGPRPERPLFDRRMHDLIPVYGLRNRVKPGVTGWARIHRKPGDQQDSVKDFEYDLYYLENLSPLMDFFIMLLSLKRVERAGDSVV
ncbi:MAG TPA: sugar transferase [Bryobacteraceae bacterium]|jgi:lipopolysaccharide/colanic/teichoic acid biosynthesis glycosyltransferase|nr:sugar transferase [Bryobacteraceae bacterium]